MQVSKIWIVKDDDFKVQTMYQTYENYFFITSDKGLVLVEEEKAKTFIRRTELPINP